MSDSDLEGTMIGGVSDREIEKRLTVGGRAPHVRPNPKSTSHDVPTNVSANKAVSVCDSTFEGVVFWLIY
jgi:hypothetical protein